MPTPKAVPVSNTNGKPVMPGGFGGGISRVVVVVVSVGRVVVTGGRP